MSAKDKGQNFTLVSCASKHHVALTSLHRVVRRPAIANTILETRLRKGRRNNLNEKEESLIVEACFNFQQNGTTNDRNCFKDLDQTFVETLPETRRGKMNSKNSRPGDKWLRSFLSRNDKLSLTRRINIEYNRSKAMNP